MAVVREHRGHHLLLQEGALLVRPTSRRRFPDRAVRRLCAFTRCSSLALDIDMLAIFAAHNASSARREWVSDNLQKYLLLARGSC